MKKRLWGETNLLATERAEAHRDPKMFAGKHVKVDKSKREGCSDQMTEKQKLAGLVPVLNWCLWCASIADVNDFGYHNVIPLLEALIFKLRLSEDPDHPDLEYLLANPFGG